MIIGNKKDGIWMRLGKGRVANVFMIADLSRLHVRQEVLSIIESAYDVDWTTPYNDAAEGLLRYEATPKEGAHIVVAEHGRQTARAGL